MENKKEPLMSAEEYFEKPYTSYNYSRIYMLSFAQEYANYVTQWHLNNAKEFVWNDFDIDKQSINTAIDNYIKDNL